jgi:hypothetical protein
VQVIAMDSRDFIFLALYFLALYAFFGEKGGKNKGLNIDVLAVFLSWSMIMRIRFISEYTDFFVKNAIDVIYFNLFFIPYFICLFFIRKFFKDKRRVR